LSDYVPTHEQAIRPLIPDWQESRIQSVINEAKAHQLHLTSATAEMEMRRSLAGRSDEEAERILQIWERQIEIHIDTAEHALIPPGDAHVDFSNQDLPVTPRDPHIGIAEDIASAEARAASRIEVGPDDIAALRARYSGIGNRHTLAIGRTDVPGLESRTFEGGSPLVRRNAGLPPTEYGPIEAGPGLDSDRNHAEQDIFNQFSSTVERAGITATELEGRTFALHISNPRGVCWVCRSSLNDPNAPFGVLRQFSERFPGLIVRVTVDGPPGAEIGYKMLLLNSGECIFQ
jgi:hypothetical protein